MDVLVEKLMEMKTARVCLTALLLHLFLAAPLSAAGDGTLPTATELGRKTLLLNSAVAGGILLWGTFNWDYFNASPRADNEGWFSHSTKEGGADKLGHVYMTHLASRAFREIYSHWGYTEARAGELGVLSSLGVMTLMEAGDSFTSEFGFSYEDMLMNLAGAGFSYLLVRYPELDRKIDLRIEYKPVFDSDFEPDIFTDYERLKYLLAVKAEGFAGIESPWLKALELHLGYYARNYDDYRQARPDRRKRSLYVGLGLNVGRLLRNWVRVPVFDFLQLPYTYLPAEYLLE
jgi:uncharacterized protein YfiM (DUF2279 family)